MAGAVPFMPPYQNPNRENMTACSTQVAAFLCPSDNSADRRLAGREQLPVQPADLGVRPERELSEHDRPQRDAARDLLLQQLGARGRRDRRPEQHGLFQREDPRHGRGRIPGPTCWCLPTRRRSMPRTWPARGSCDDGPAADQPPGDELGHGRDVLHLVQPRGAAEYDHLRGADLPGNMANMAMQVPPSSNHPGGANLMMGDGSVHFIKNSVSVQTWRALGTRNNGEVISSDSY